MTKAVATDYGSHDSQKPIVGMSCGLASAVQAISCRGRAPVVFARITSRVSSALQPSNRMVVPKAVKRNNVAFFEHLFLGMRI